MVTVLVPGALRTEAGGESRLDVAAAGTLRAVLDEIDQRWPRLGRRIRDERGELRRFVNVYVDGEDCRMVSGQDTPVAGGGEVQVVPSVAGGSVAQEVFDGDRVLAENFAPWVRELGLSVQETGSDWATLRLPWSDRLAREGGAMSGQALMAAADTATVIAVSAARGGFVPMTTVQLSTTFQRPVLGSDVLVTARLTKLGRTMAFADITMTANGALVAHATTVYALL
ncbi:MoaD/ThiS family protein [Catellatospora methionotrophica]|uniref:MoaD/ThiS family protein n=1 Tax=Catellatospora methionotrophica TaxID=121620 RepID=UPI0033EF890A